MLQKISFLVWLLALGVMQVVAQEGKITGVVRDEKGAPVEYATVLLMQKDLVRNGSQTDANGKYSIQPVEPGVYNVVVKYLNTNKTVEGVEIIAGQTYTQNVSFEKSSELVTETIELVAEATAPVFSPNPTVVNTVSGQEYKNLGVRSVAGVAVLTPGVYASEDGTAISVRGARESSTVYYIDGVKVRGNSNIPQSSIKQLQVITGGTPAEFGDFTGGVVSITTNGPSATFSGGGELMTSRGFDAYGRDLAAINLSGPLLKRDEEMVTASGDKISYKRSVLGYFINAEYDASADQDPAALGIFRLKGDLLSQLEQNPLRPSEDGRSFRNNALYINRDDLEEVKAKSYNSARNIRVLGRIDIEPSKNMQIKLGGNAELIQNDQWGITSTLFAPASPAQFTGQQYRGWARIQQSFQGDSNATFRNFFYMLQADYSLYNRNFTDRNHGTNLFDYGFVGTFNYDREPFYTYVDDPTNPTVASSGPYWQTAAYGFNNLSYDPSGTKNPVYSNYNSYIFDYVAENGIVNPLQTLFMPSTIINNVGSLSYLQFFNGVRNGDAPVSIYGLFRAPGSNYVLYNKFAYEQFRLQGQSTAEIGGHNLKFGFEFEQRNERSYTIYASSLWTRMRQYANNHLQTLETDQSLWTPVIVDGEFQDTINVPLAVGEQLSFDQKLRAKINEGKSPEDAGYLKASDWLNIDAYTPEQYEQWGGLNLFTADELMGNDGTGPLADANAGAGYLGYTYLGEKMKGRVDPFAFFTDTANRPMNAFSPTYISGFLQDKFEFEDIVFNAGLRIDYFDANQKVLKDDYSLYPTYSAEETASKLGVSRPGNVESGEEWVAYVDNTSNPTEIFGYRNGESWYDANGVPTTSSAIGAKSNGRPIPHTREQKVAQGSFKDYAPQTVVMPRISFSFPLNETAQFFAHYDILAQRPGQVSPTSGSLLASQISDYYFLQYRPTIEVNNPNLKPEVTIDYEAGFKQVLDQEGRLALGISAFYREMRNMVRYRRFNNAYPFSYDTYANLDFGTVKGLTLDFRMNRVKNLMLRGAYTLQFAQTTGSSFSSGRNVVDLLEGTGILRTTLADDRDQRHRITGIIDYRFVGTKGPKISFGGKDFYPFNNSGANFNFRLGSGTPYSQNAFAVPSVVSGVPIVNQIVGTPNGSRKPFTFGADMRVDKGFEIKRGDKEYLFNVYFLILNVFDTRNVINVYRYTGLPDDDGYLESGIGQQAIAAQVDPTAYTDLYRTRVRNPDNYSAPRRMRMGIEFNF